MTIFTVGAGSGFDYSTLASAIAASRNGDVIQVQAGTYTNDFATITTSITIEGVGGMVNLVATQAPPNLKGILSIGTDGTAGPNVTLDNIAFSGAAIPNSDGGNGAGIRYQSGNLVLNNCFFFNNQDGLLADAAPAGTITINNSEFNNNGNANAPLSGIEHNLYVGKIQQLTIDNSYFVNPIGGHDIKSRALNTTIQNSRIDDPNATGNYEIDLPNGGNAVIKSNVIEKGGNAQNSNFIAFGEEANLNANSALSVTGNTIINDRGSNANFVLNTTTIPVSVTGNTGYGLAGGQIAVGPVALPETNTLNPRSSAPALDTSVPYLPVLPFSFACFAAGTRIQTTDGPIPVEALRVGQQVVVVRSAVDGEPPINDASRSINWIGHRSIDLARHPDPDLVRPIRIRADAFADGVPLRDLLVSPDHAIYVNGLLISVRLLRNGGTILREDHLQAVQYFHVELDRHDILLAEGLPAETYLDTGNRGQFENAGASVTPHPELIRDNGQARREQFSCAPFADADRIEPVWRGLAIRAGQLGHTINQPAAKTDPELHLSIDGRDCWPVAVTERRHVFVVPRSAVSVRVVSHATAPCEVKPWIEDRRRLGVAVARIVLRVQAEVSEMPPDHPSLTDGWWAAEQTEAKLWRWTNGNAVLPLRHIQTTDGTTNSAPDRTPGVTIVEIHLAGETARGHSEAIQKDVVPACRSMVA